MSINIDFIKKENNLLKYSFYISNIVLMSIFYSYFSPIIADWLGINIYKIAKSYFIVGFTVNLFFVILSLQISKNLFFKLNPELKRVTNFNNLQLFSIFPSSTILGIISIYLLFFSETYIKISGENFSIHLMNSMFYNLVIPIIFLFTMLLTIIIQVVIVYKITKIEKYKLVFSSTIALSSSIIFMLLMIYIQALFISFIGSFFAFFGFPG